MELKHDPNLVEVSTMLSEAMEQYQDQNYYSSLTKVIYDLIDYIEEYSKKCTVFRIGESGFILKGSMIR